MDTFPTGFNWIFIKKFDHFIPAYLPQLRSIIMKYEKIFINGTSVIDV